MLVPIEADELAVLLEARNADDALAQFGVGDRDAHAVGFGEDGFLVDQLFEQTPLEPQLFDQLIVHRAAVLRPEGVQLLLVDRAERAGADGAAVDRGDAGVCVTFAMGPPGVRRKLGTAGAQTSLTTAPRPPPQDAFVLAHLIEHRHSVGLPRTDGPGPAPLDRRETVIMPYGWGASRPTRPVRHQTGRKT